MPRMGADNQADIEAHLTKNRIAAVDITRVLASLFVMYEHLQPFGLAGDCGKVAYRIEQVLVEPSNAVFFLFAGYFASRNISWKKAVTNAWWCFASFMLWCLVAAWVEGEWSWHIFGMDYVIECRRAYNAPINGPLWFMRDLVFLFLLSPLIYRFSRILLPALLVMSALPQLGNTFDVHPLMVLAPYTVLFFTLGCFLRRLSKESQQKVLHFTSLPLIVVFYLVVFMVWLGGIRGASFIDNSWQNRAAIVSVFSLWVVYQMARQIEIRSEWLTKLCLKIAPVAFLTFAAHWPIFRILSWYEGKSSPWFLLTPVGVYVVMSLFFFALKRWAKPLLHLVAHYKLRPDDLQGKNTTC